MVQPVSVILGSKAQNEAKLLLDLDYFLEQPHQLCLALLTPL